jgi:hypothetical protein
LFGGSELSTYARFGSRLADFAAAVLAFAAACVGFGFDFAAARFAARVSN